MIKVEVTKNLIGVEDLLLGVGFAMQQRGPSTVAPVQITKINGANFPYDETYTMQQKFNALEALIDTLPVVVDQDGNLLTGYINTSAQNLNLAGRLWRKELSGSAALYYGTQFLFEYSLSGGGIIIPEDTNYIAADNVIIQAYQAADAVIAQDLVDLEQSLKGGAFVDVGTGANQLVQLDSAARLPAVDGSQLINVVSVPIGTIIAVAHTGVEAGYLDCDGSTISRTTYALLFGKLGTTYGQGDGSTTFQLPDLRSEFVRGWDNGRNLDQGRQLGSVQSQSIEAHTHASGTLATASAGAHTHTLQGDASSGTGQQVESGSGAQINTITTSSAGAHTHTITGSTAATGSTETRPRNIALRYLIKAL